MTHENFELKIGDYATNQLALVFVSPHLLASLIFWYEAPNQLTNQTTSFYIQFPMKSLLVYQIYCFAL